MSRTDIELVEEANTTFYETMERGDFEKLSGLWLDDEISCIHPGWPVLSGRGEVLRSYALIMANTEYIQFFLTDVKVNLAGDTALVDVHGEHPQRRPGRGRRRARSSRRAARGRHECVPSHRRGMEDLVTSWITRPDGKRRRGGRGVPLVTG